MKADDSYYTAPEDMSVDKDRQSFAPWVFFYSSPLLTIQTGVNILLIFLIAHAVNPRSCLEMFETFKNIVETFINIYIGECVCVCILPCVYTSLPVVRSGPNLAHTCRFISKG